MASLVPLILLAGIAAGLGWIAYLGFSKVGAHQRSLNAAAKAERIAETRLGDAMRRPGATPDAPISIDSAAAIEARAQSEPCPICDGHLHVEEHEVQREAGARLRHLKMKCGQCGRRSALYFRVSPALLN